jgi:hypothetical protein
VDGATVQQPAHIRARVAMYLEGRTLFPIFLVIFSFDPIGLSQGHRSLGLWDIRQWTWSDPSSTIFV